ncbi:glycosyltransferase [Candidatus Hydrogenedentota bacterium]
MRILFLQPDCTELQSDYQQNFPDALANVHEVFRYGEGYPDYSVEHTIEDVLGLCPFTPELICFGAAWENDEHPTAFDPHTAINTSGLDIPAVMILNKEYKKLDEKFKFVANNNIRKVFTVHHNFRQWQEKTGVPFVHFPFAIDAEVVKAYGEPKKYDLGFAGNLHTAWTDMRLKVKNRIFWGGGRFRRPRYLGIRTYWREWNQGLKSGEDYARLMNSSKLWISTPSAIDLIGPRFYEVMGTKSLLFCSRSPVYEGLFEEGKHCVMFAEDLSDFDEKLFHYLKHEDERLAVVERAYSHVREHHTWKRRVEQFSEAVVGIVRHT